MRSASVDFVVRPVGNLYMKHPAKGTLAIVHGDGKVTFHNQDGHRVPYSGVAHLKFETQAKALEDMTGMGWQEIQIGIL
jgi:hypothetical protein